MKKLGSLMVLSVAMTLTACGGDSDSSGGNSSDDSNYQNFGKVLPATTCDIEGRVLVKVPKEGCVFSLQRPKYGGGDTVYTQTYTCINNNKVSDGTVFGYSLSYGRYNFSCAR